MSEKDTQLIQQAESIDCWSLISDLEKQAESDMAKRLLHIRKMHLYRQEEVFAGTL